MSFGLRENVEQADWLHLTDGEAVRWTGRPSRLTLVPSLTVALLLVAVGIALTAIGRPVVAGRGWPVVLGYLPLVIVLIGVGYGVVVYLHWLRLLYVITDEEIYVKIGLVSRDVTQIPLARVQNTSYSQSVLERLLSFGDIDVYTAGTHTEDVTLENVPNPERIKAILTAQLSDRHAEAQAPADGL